MRRYTAPGKYNYTWQEMLPPHTLELQNRDTNEFIAIQGSFYIFADFPKNASFKSNGVICLPRAAPASLSFSPHEISFYASVKPIATFSLHRQGACGRQRAIRWHRLVKRHRYTITNTKLPRLLAHIRNINRGIIHN